MIANILHIRIIFGSNKRSENFGLSFLEYALNLHQAFLLHTNVIKGVII